MRGVSELNPWRVAEAAANTAYAREDWPGLVAAFDQLDGLLARVYTRGG